MNVNRIAKGILVGWLGMLMAWGVAARADEIVTFSFGGCVDAAGKPVPSKADPSLETLLNTAEENGQRVIRYNPALLPQLLPETRAFLFAHECAWTHLNMAIAGVRSVEQAQRADCWAVETLLRSRLVSRESLPAVEADLEMVADKQDTLPQPARPVNLRSCAAVRNVADKAGSVLAMPHGAGDDRWNACTQACGADLFRCGRGEACTRSFDQCVAVCTRRDTRVKP